MAVELTLVVLSVAQTAVAVWLAVYGLNSLILAALYLIHRKRRPKTGPERPSPTDWPTVTVQIPVFNERHVVERVIDAVAALQYPRDKLQIQVLDDSTDETTLMALRRAYAHHAAGVGIQVLRRGERTGYKAGALAFGFERADGDYIAIFDADFCPPSDFLLRTVPHFLVNPRLGMVQTRWSYLNGEYSLLTRAQTLALDGHFVVEQSARNRSNLLMSFNGSAGVWRRDCIEGAGGWDADTLCEDLDLSYRAQLEGWTCLYLPEVASPGEVPPQIAAFKRQQMRWAQGSVQVFRKLVGKLVCARGLRSWQKAMAIVHLSSYLAHPLMVMLLLVTLPCQFVPDSAQFTIGGLGVICLAPPVVYVISQWELYSDWRQRLTALPALLLLGVGIAWCNTRAAWRGATRWGGAFKRTPKFSLEGRHGRWSESGYRLVAGPGLLGEILLAVYAAVATGVAVQTRHFEMVPLTLLYAAGFTLVAGLGLYQASPLGRK
jgi:cellulose synthase/poly-beta-1,6-N-acetylglucosamine synthase-like glycosyltransferase